MGSVTDKIKKLPVESGMTVVSITPVPLERDSRTFKQAASLARDGYRSIVMEAIMSETPPPGDFELIVLARPFEPTGQGPLPASLLRSVLDSAGRLLRRCRLGMVDDAMVFLLFLGHYAREQLRQPLKVVPKADLYILHSFYQYTLVRRLARRDGAALIYDAHDFYTENKPADHLSALDRRWLWPFYAFLERRCVRSADKLMTVSDGVARLIADRFDCAPIVVRNIHDHRLDKTVATSIREVAGVSQNDFLFVCIGNWKEGIALDAVLEALAKTPVRVHLAFVGRDYDCIEAEVSKSPVADRVHLLPPVGPEHVVPFASEADAAAIFFYAYTENYRFSLPNRFFQSIATGLPLICPQLPEMKKLTERLGNAIFVDTTPPVEIAKAMTSMAENAAMRSRMMQAASVAAKKLIWRNEEKRFLDVVCSSLGQAPSAVAETKTDASTP